MFEVLATALIGGLILNVMPCVLPVLALKAFHVVEGSNDAPEKRRKHGFAYTAGTMSLFIALATLAVVAKSVLGKSVMWGQQFQSPYFVAFMTSLVFAFGLNALGVFEITMSMSREDAKEDKLSGSYANGLFAAIMATPCSAPFLGTAVVYALGSTASWWQTELVFAMIGLGLALPYLTLMLVPAFAKILPRPGAWMMTVKSLMGFALMGTAVWLYRTLQKQVTADSANGFLFFLIALAVVLWFGGRYGGVAAPTVRRWVIRGGQLAVLAMAGYFALHFVKPEPALAEECLDAPAVDAGGKVVLDDPIVNGHIKWTAFTEERMKAELARNRPVFVDFTAEWCASCQANDKAFIETDLVRGTFQKTGILPMQVDMTNDNPAGDKWMKELGRNGIPIYVIFYPDGSRDLMPTVITAEMVSEHLEDAAKKYPQEKFASR